nr:CAAX amino terminal protease [Tanacetum cinerariifolium]
WRLATLPIKLGGLGIFLAGDIIQYTFLSSRLQTSALQSKILLKTSIVSQGSFKHALDTFNTTCNVDVLSVTIFTSSPQMMKTLAKCYFGVVKKVLVSKLLVPMFSEGVKFRHNLVRGILVDVCSKVGIMVRKEASMCFLSEDGKDLRPVDLLLLNWLQDENPIRTLGDYSKPSHEGYRNTIELLEGNNMREEINDRMIEMFWLLKELTTSRAPKKVLIREEAKHPTSKNINSISLIRGEEEKNDDDNATTGDSIKRPDGSDTKMPLKEVKKENESENVTKNETIESVEKELTRAEKEEAVEAPGSQPVGYYLKHKINKKLIEGLVENHRFNDSLSAARVGKMKWETYNLLHREPVYEAILKKNITKKEDIGGNFEIPYNIGGITEDVLVDVAGYVYPVEFVILDIKEDKKRPFILGTPFLTTAKAVIKFDKGTITLRFGKSKMSFHRRPESLSRKSLFLEDKQIPSVGVLDEVSFYILFQALGWHLEEIHVTWAHLKKKQTRLRLYTIYLQELCLQIMETALQTSSTASRFSSWRRYGFDDSDRMAEVTLKHMGLWLCGVCCKTHSLWAKCHHGKDIVPHPDCGDGVVHYVLYDLTKPQVPYCSKQIDQVEDLLYDQHAGFTLALLGSFFSKGLRTVKSCWNP